MTEEELYLAEQEYSRYQFLMYTCEKLTQDEYNFCFSWDYEETRLSTFKIGENAYLNLNVYSEINKEEYDLRREIGT